MRQPLIPLLLLTVTLAGSPLLAQDGPATPTPPAPPKDERPEVSLTGGPARFEAAFLTERFRDRFQKAFEKALGRKLDKPIEFVITDSMGMKALVESESGPLGAKLTDVTPEQFLEQSRALSKAVLGKVRTSDGKIVINPETFEAFSKLYHRECRGQAFLDALLIHEAVHAAQHQKRSIATFMAGQTTTAALRARMSVVEGHAQHVARAATKELGLEASFQLLVKVTSELPKELPAAEREVMRVLLAEISIPYVQGETFIRALAKALGSTAKAEERAFQSPPTTIRQITRPEEYLNPPQERVEVQPLVKKMSGKLGIPELDAPVQIAPISDAQLRAALALADQKLLERCLKELNSSVVMVAGNRKGQQGIMVVNHFASKQGAEDLLKVERQVLAQKDKDFSRPDSPYKITSLEYEQSPFKGIAGFTSARTVSVQGGTVTVYTVVLQFDEWCIEAFLSNVMDDKTKLLAFLERALPVLGAKIEREGGAADEEESKSEEGESEEDKTSGEDGEEKSE